MSGFVMCMPVRWSANYSRDLIYIEENFDHCRAFRWLEANWTMCYYFIVAYLVAIFAGQEYMKSRPAFQLRGALLFWNVLLASYSIMATWRLIPTMIYAIQHSGFSSSVCDLGPVQHRQAVAIWLWLFTISKIAEFGDTAFIVFRKSKLVFLHWYHHVSVTFFVWSCGAYPSPMHIYFMTANVLVHSIMYSYYALSVLKVRIPAIIRMAITSLQILQMLFGVFITGYTYLAKAADKTCMIQDQAITIAITIYFSYFVLFLHFFIRAYFKKGPVCQGKIDVHAKKID